jgi:hypothetical protein
VVCQLFIGRVSSQWLGNFRVTVKAQPGRQFMRQSPSYYSATVLELNDPGFDMPPTFCTRSSETPPAEFFFRRLRHLFFLLFVRAGFGEFHDGM